LDFQKKEELGQLLKIVENLIGFVIHRMIFGIGDDFLLDFLDDYSHAFLQTTAALKIATDSDAGEDDLHGRALGFDAIILDKRRVTYSVTMHDAGAIRRQRQRVSTVVPPRHKSLHAPAAIAVPFLFLLTLPFGLFVWWRRSFIVVFVIVVVMICLVIIIFVTAGVIFVRRTELFRQLSKMIMEKEKLLGILTGDFEAAVSVSFQLMTRVWRLDDEDESHKRGGFVVTIPSLRSRVLKRLYNALNLFECSSGAVRRFH